MLGLAQILMSWVIFSFILGIRFSTGLKLTGFEKFLWILAYILFLIDWTILIVLQSMLGE